MKKVLILFLAAALLLPLAACGGTGDKQDITGPTATDDPTTDTQTPTNDLEDTMRTLIVKNEKMILIDEIEEFTLLPLFERVFRWKSNVEEIFEILDENQ